VNALRVVRIAHAYGNRRDTLRRALQAPVDMIEADIWRQAGDLHVRHELRLGPFPLLADRRPDGPKIGPYAIPLPGRHYLRLDVNPLTLRELLRTVAGTKRLLLDVKSLDRSEAQLFATILARQIQEHDAVGWVAVCGQYWPVLDRLRKIAPHVEVRYSMQSQDQWDGYQHRLTRGRATTRVCIHHRFIDGTKAEFLEAHAIDTYCWTVDDPGEADVLVQRGVDGIISNNLDLLAALPKPAAM